MKIQDIKAKLDIISIAENYGFKFSGTGNRLRAEINRFRDEKTSSLDFFKDTQKFFDRGDDSIRGDVIDVIRLEEGITENEAIRKAKEMAGESNYTYTRREVAPKANKEKKQINFTQMKNQAISELTAVKKLNPCYVLEIEQNGKTVQSNVTLNKEFDRLFEGVSFSTDLEKKFIYTFNHLVGWSDFWKSPSLILKDCNGKVVDIVAYRPKDKAGKEIRGMKYYYKNFLDRGDSFIYPYQKEVELIAERERYIIIGEGLKNALNALIYGVPFLTIESTGNTSHISDNMKETIAKYIKKGWGIATAFDGDKSGEKAYHDFLSLLGLGLEVENILSFSSNQDFVDYLRAN